MKLAAAFFLPFVGLSIAQSSSKVPEIYLVQTGVTNGCLDLQKLRISWTDQALSFDMQEFYADMNGHNMNPPVTTYGICVVYMNLKFREGWRFKFTNVTYKGHAKTSNKSFVSTLLTTTYLQYTRSKFSRDGDLTEREYRADEMSDILYSPGFGRDGDYDSDFEVTAQPWTLTAGTPLWSPCMPAYSADTQELKLMVQHHGGFNRADNNVSITTEATIGTPTSGMKASIGVEWEKCDPAKFPVDSWGTRRGARGEALPPKNYTTTPGEVGEKVEERSTSS